MEAEAFPIRFTRGVRAYWRRRKYHRLDGGKASSSKSTQQLGGAAAHHGGWGSVRRLRVRVRAFMTAPRRALARARDAYVGGMLALARKASAVALPGAPESVWAKRVPRRKQQQQLLPAPRTTAAGGQQQQQQPSEFEQRLIVEIYKSIVASKELTTMLHSSTAHRQTTTPAAAFGVGVGHRTVHLLDM